MVVIYFSAEQSAWNFKVINCSSEVRELQFKVTILIDDMPEEMVVLPAAHHLELQKYLPVIGRPVLKKQVAREKDGKVLRASVAIHTAICPECGRSYISGGTTHTLIKYPNESNPYQKGRKAQHAMALAGMNFDAGV